MSAKKAKAKAKEPEAPDAPVGPQGIERVFAGLTDEEAAALVHGKAKRAKKTR